MLPSSQAQHFQCIRLSETKFGGVRTLTSQPSHSTFNDIHEYLGASIGKYRDRDYLTIT